MKWMDQLPSVVSCCFCCYLKAGNVTIALVSFTVGLILAPNVANTRLPWDPKDQAPPSELTIQVALGVLSVILCICSFFLFVGAICSVPILIEVYQWGAAMYGMITGVMYLMLAYFCFFVHTESIVAGCWLIGIALLDVLLTIYFLIVANSLRMSVLFLYSTEVMY